MTESAIAESAAEGAVPAGTSRLRARGLVKAWGASRVLDGVDVDLEAGAMTWLRGRNGVGKTTLMRMLAGLMYPEEGTVEAEGVTPQSDRREYQRRVAMLAAGDRGLYGRLTVGHHLDWWSRMVLIPRAQRRDAIAQVVEQFFLGDFLDRRVDRMSMGQRQRVRLAMTLLPRPRVVLLDEPLNSLDEEGTTALAQWLHGHVAAGGSGLWISPGGDAEVFPFARRLELKDGKAVEA